MSISPEKKKNKNKTDKKDLYMHVGITASGRGQIRRVKTRQISQRKKSTF